MDGYNNEVLYKLLDEAVALLEVVKDELLKRDAEPAYVTPPTVVTCSPRYRGEQHQRPLVSLKLQSVDPKRSSMVNYWPPYLIVVVQTLLDHIKRAENNPFVLKA